MRALLPAVALLAPWSLLMGCTAGSGPPRPYTPVTYSSEPAARGHTPAASREGSPDGLQAGLPAGLPEGDPRSSPSASTPGGAARHAVTQLPEPASEWRAVFEGRRPRQSFVGRATYYHDDLAGNFTACGDKYTPSDFTAAHRTLPFGTILRVVHPSSGRDVYVRVNDRGPFGDRRLVLDLSRAAARRLGLLRYGVMKVRAEVLELGDAKAGRCGIKLEDRR